MFFTQLSAKNTQRASSTYLGGEVRNLTEASSIHVAFAFEGANHKNSLPLLIAQEVLGNSRRAGRIQKNILSKNAFIDGAQAFNASYEDNGIFGLKVSGSASHVIVLFKLGPTSGKRCRPRTRQFEKRDCR
jgi:predicted Zn-dependent peptidase